MKKTIFFFWLVGTVCSFSDIHLMLVGDSITQGVKSANGLGFRDDLYDSLKAHAYPVDLAGATGTSPYQGHFRSGAHIADFYTGPDGNGTIDIVWDMDNIQPQIIMVHMGSNDLFSSDPIVPYTENGGETFATQTISGKLAFFLSYSLQWKNGQRGDWVKAVYVSKIIPRLDCMNRVAVFNDEIARIVQDSQEGRIPGIPPGCLKLVDHFTSFDPFVMMDEDGIHPNELGYIHMAGVFFRTVEAMPMVLAKYSGDGQDGTVQSELPEPLVVQVLSGSQDSVAGVPVHFEVLSGDASLIGFPIMLTNRNGKAGIQVKMGGPGKSVIRTRADCFSQFEVTFTVSAGLYARVKGKVMYGSQNVPVPNVLIQWMENGIEDTTLQDGSYTLERLPYQGNVTIKPEKKRLSDVPEGTILSYDAALTAGAVAGSLSLSPSTQLAADADGDGAITMYDAFQIARFAVGFSSSGSSRLGEWKFIPNSRIYQPIVQNWENQVFNGILVGDVHEGWAKQKQFPKSMHSSGEWVVYPTIRNDSLVVVPIGISGQGILSLDMSCLFQTDQVEWIRPRLTADVQWVYNADHPGSLKMGLFSNRPISSDRPILNLEIKPKSDNHQIQIRLTDMFLNDTSIEETLLDVDRNYSTIEPQQLGLLQNYPNPFNEETTISYVLPETRSMQLMITDIVGKEIVCLVQGNQSQGQYLVHWNGLDKKGKPVPSGLYLYQLRMGTEVKTGRMEKIR